MLDVLNLIGDPEFKYGYNLWIFSQGGKKAHKHVPAMLGTVLGVSWCSFMDHLHFGRTEVKKSVLDHKEQIKSSSHLL